MGDKEGFSKRYNAKQVEEKWYHYWENNNHFHEEPDPKRVPYCIVIPPPNITGILHMGHALNNTIQDILIRFRRMQGYCCLWIPGTDHAGIATQNVVEKELAKEGITRKDLGREKFLERVWQWKEKYGNTIIHQLKKLGCSCDWKRTRFTMDQELSQAVVEAFLRLYEKGLIYRGNYIINWCPRCGTALSDEEVEYKELESYLYYIKYPVSDRKGKYVTVATTRPETMLGDVAVAIHPEDKRYEFLADKELILPLLGRKLKIIKDMAVDPEFGSGAVKVTPAHDPLDFEIGLRHGLKPIVVMTPEAKMNQNAGPYQGLDRFQCRKKVIEDLKKQDLLEKVDPHLHSVGHCYRCETIIEPYISRQWFVHMKPLAQPAINVVKEGKVKFYPERWSKVYLHWMENIKDWCISRQIWWGHRIPVYYCKNCYQETGADEFKQEAKQIKGLFVSGKKPQRCSECGGTDIVQDQDVLDTWFSSWLWPFSTMNWPQEERSRLAGSSKDIKDIDYFYPTSTLVTAQEILFFWVARMIMAGLEFIGEIPFKDVYIHGTVRDEKGRKMSKSLGNIIDPLEIIEEYGADALRFSLISITAMGQDVFLSKERFLSGRNFTNKIWNAARFIYLNIEPFEEVKIERFAIHESWLLSSLQRLIATVTASLENYNFNEAILLLYDYFWHKFCDWYIELSKPALSSKSAAIATRSKAILCYALDNLMRLLHPFMPFITEEIWQKFYPYYEKSYKILGIKFLPSLSLMKTPWPREIKEFYDQESEELMEIIISAIQTLRNMRAELNIDVKKKPAVIILTKENSHRLIYERYEREIKTLANVGAITISQVLERPSHSALGIVKDDKIYLLLEGILDIDREKKRLSKKLDKLSQELRIVEKRLQNKEFLSKAASYVIEKTQKRREELRRTISHLKNYLETL